MPTDRSIAPSPPAPWVAIVLADLAMPAQLLDAASDVVWQTPRTGPAAGGPVVTVPAIDAEGGALRLCLDLTAHDAEIDAVHNVTAREGEHRARNIVALALAIAHQSLGDRLHDPVVERFLDRLRSLDAVARVGCEVEGDRCTVGTVARQIMKRFDDPQHPQIHLAGPPTVIPARSAHLIAMVLHELGANAIRHGSLRERGGEVQLRWCAIPDGARGTCTVQLSWREIGGAPLRPAGARGFGSRILRDISSVSRRCSASFNLLPTGLDYRLSIELEAREVSYG